MNVDNIQVFSLVVSCLRPLSAHLGLHGLKFFSGARLVSEAKARSQGVYFGLPRGARQDDSDVRRLHTTLSTSLPSPRPTPPLTRSPLFLSQFLLFLCCLFSSVLLHCLTYV
ncbi:hypothetical protein E2C01_001040 [Portunus trituberculatus]|uniref:Uncharacterized protein n=1 Tax=Portunus trituberculatus TaxID=210409 RepID=A0A5B7CLH9_PORTR|nr:hypothetical protein [Portunus trituberculatus]